MPITKITIQLPKTLSWDKDSRYPQKDISNAFTETLDLSKHLHNLANFITFINLVQDTTELPAIIRQHFKQDARITPYSKKKRTYTVCNITITDEDH